MNDPVSASDLHASPGKDLINRRGRGRMTSVKEKLPVWGEGESGGPAVLLIP